MLLENSNNTLPNLRMIIVGREKKFSNFQQKKTTNLAFSFCLRAARLSAPAAGVQKSDILY